MSVVFFSEDEKMLNEYSTIAQIKPTSIQLGHLTKIAIPSLNVIR